MTLAPDHTVAVIGAGIGGLSAAITLASRGVDVTLLERADTVGGKIRQEASGAGPIDAGPTVFTMPWVFDALFDEAGASFRDAVRLTRAERIARHYWQDGSALDLWADVDRSIEAISAFAGSKDGLGFASFIARAQKVYELLRPAFLEAGKPNPVSLAMRIGAREALTIQPFHRLMSVLEQHFEDPRLRQLFGRYATYCGSSPYLATATLMLIAYVEQEGVYYLDGGMYSLASALADLAVRLGVKITCGAEVERVAREQGRFRLQLRGGEPLTASRVIANADAGGIARGLLGATCAKVVSDVPDRARSLSAVTWTFSGRSTGAGLCHHNVCFSNDYKREFDALHTRAGAPEDPTVYICAQNRHGSATDSSSPQTGDEERFLCLVNAPSDGDTREYPTGELERCRNNMLNTLNACGVVLEPTGEMQPTTPAGFERRFPGSGGAIYGRASHGWMSTFLRAGNRTRLPGFYLAGGSVHPGPGVPMAALSGRLAAQALMEDSTSRSRSSATATPGGISMR